MVIDQQRNQRFWQACGWKQTHYAEDGYSHYDWRIGAQGYHILPDPSDPVFFTGYLLRDGLPKVRDCEVTIALKDNGKAVCEIAFDDPLLETIHEEAPTLSDALFNALEKALGLDKEEK